MIRGSYFDCISQMQLCLAYEVIIILYFLDMNQKLTSRLEDNIDTLQRHTADLSLLKYKYDLNRKRLNDYDQKFATNDYAYRLSTRIRNIENKPR